MKATLVTEAAELARLEPAWWDLFRRCPDTTPFSSPAWLLPWWQVFEPGVLRTVAVQDEGGRLVGLAPLYLEEGSLGRRLLPLGIGVSDHTDILLDPAVASAAAAVLAAALDAGPGSWDCWSAEEACPGAAILGMTMPDGWSERRAQGAACPVLALSGPDVADAIPGPMRRKWAMARNRTTRRFGTVRPTTAETLAADLANLCSLHAARWEARGQAGVLAADPVRRFHEAAAPRLLAAGLLRMATLRFGEAVAGVYQGLHHRDRAFAYLGGFDPTFAFESPGTVLVGAAIEAAAAEGATAFSFLRGQEPYKYRWGAVDTWSTTRIFEPRR